MAQIEVRDTHADTIRRLCQWAEAPEFANQLMRAVRTRSDHLHANWLEFQRAHNVIMLDATDAERATNQALYVDIENAYLTATELMMERIHQVEQGEPRANVIDNDDRESIRSERSQRSRSYSPPPVPNAQQNQMPQIGQVIPNAAAIPGIGQIPWQFRLENTWGEFDGDFMKWPAFHDSFRHTVYEDVNIRPVRKLQILKAALKGRALKAFGEWMICDNNFEPAWLRLKELFDDQYKTSKELLNKLIHLKKLDTPHGGRLQTMSNTVQEVVRQLGAMGYAAEHFDMIFIHIVQDKLDPQTSIAWDKERLSARPTLEQLKKFLDREAKALMNAYDAKVEPKPKEQKDRKRTGGAHENQRFHKRSKSNRNHEDKREIKTEKSACAMCTSEVHPTRTCAKFLALNLTNRREQIQKASRCFNCLQPGHTVKDCRSRACNRCENKKHSDILCPENPQNRKVNVGQVKGNKKAKKGGKKDKKGNQKSQ